MDNFLLSNFLGWWGQRSWCTGQRVKVGGKEGSQRANCSEIIVQSWGRGGRDRKGAFSRGI